MNSTLVTRQFATSSSSSTPISTTTAASNANSSSGGGLISSVLACMAAEPVAPFIVGVVIGVPSALLYLLQTLVIVFRRTSIAEFKSSFYTLVVVRAGISLVNYVFTYLNVRLGLVGLFSGPLSAMPRLALAVLFFAQYYLFHAENLATIAQLLNRFTAVAFPTKYHNISHYLMPASVIVVFIAPLSVTAHIFTLDLFASVHGDHATIDLHPTPEQIDDSMMGAIGAVLFLLISAALNVATYTSYVRTKKQLVRKTENKGDKAVETRLTIYTVLTFFSQLMMAIFMALIYATGSLFRYIWVEDDNLFFATFNQLPWISDLCTIAFPAWLLLWASSAVREGIVSTFRHATGGGAKNSNETRQESALTVTNSNKLFVKRAQVQSASA